MTNLKRMRLSKKMTQADVARFLGISVRMYQYIESLQHYPSWKVAIKLEDLFGKPARKLLEKEQA